jgi:hypothetical protein
VAYGITATADDPNRLGYRARLHSALFPRGLGRVIGSSKANRLVLKLGAVRTVGKATGSGFVMNVGVGVVQSVLESIAEMVTDAFQA